MDWRGRTFPLASRSGRRVGHRYRHEGGGRPRAARRVVQLGRPEHTPGRVLALGHEHLPVGKQRRGGVAACCGGTAKTTAERTAARVRTRLLLALTIRAPRHVPLEPGWPRRGGRPPRPGPPNGAGALALGGAELSDALLGR